MRTYFTSESVTEGHPDKVADQISDAILDALLTVDPHARVAVETLVTTGLVVIAGEVRTSAYVDMQQVARRTIAQIGYDQPGLGFDAHSSAIMLAIDDQSPDIAQGVDPTTSKSLGAGDQGIMFGYATAETPEHLPLPIAYAHRLSRRLAEVRRSGQLPWLRPDGKTQVTFAYDDGVPVGISAVVVSAQHTEDITLADVRTALRQHVIQPVCGNLLLPDCVLHLNPTGRFVLGGPAADAGLTGRKVIIDTYGGFARHGGGAFSGKDPSKVDRSASYAARWVAKSLVAAGLAQRAEVQLAYAIGVSQPVSVRVESFGTSPHTDESLAQLVTTQFDLTPAGIIRDLDLLRPIYLPTAAYGHFGRDLTGTTWESPRPLSL